MNKHLPNSSTQSTVFWGQYWVLKGLTFLCECVAVRDLFERLTYLEWISKHLDRSVHGPVYLCSPWVVISFVQKPGWRPGRLESGEAESSPSSVLALSREVETLLYLESKFGIEFQKRKQRLLNWEGDGKIHDTVIDGEWVCVRVYVRVCMCVCVRREKQRE